MAVSTKCVACSVDDLRPGLFVVEPDVPWTELPFLFQGFEIESEDEIRVFRSHCSHVYVDPERSSEMPEPAVTPAAAVARQKPGKSEPRPDAGAEQHLPRRRRTNTARTAPSEALDSDDRYPDVDSFREEVESVSRVRETARKYVEEAFKSANQGASLDVDGARSVISDLMTRITEKPTASVWLTSLNDCDDYTTSHSVNTCVLVLSFCMRAKLDAQKLEVIGLGSLLHDVGKSELPPELLNRPEPLTEAEWEQVKQHPLVGRRMLADSGNVPRGALNIVAMHHERRDGGGYPQGLMGSDLPDYVLLSSLANRYHALTSPRPYREPAAPDKVLQDFYNEADASYGTHVVQAFMRSVGLYPVGSIVELDNGALGVVVSSRPNARLRPTVLLVRTPDGLPYQKTVLLNLAAEHERRFGNSDDDSHAHKVKRVRSPGQTGIDPGAVIADAFGIALK